MALMILLLQKGNLVVLKIVKLGEDSKFNSIIILPISLFDTSFEAILLIAINDVPLSISTIGPLNVNEQ